jgi:Peptidase family C25
MKPVRYRNSRRALVALLVAAALGWILFGKFDPVQAAAFTVNDPGDSGAGSGTTGDLRYCITQANAAGGTNTISFSVTGTINLLNFLPFINGNLTINGPGANLLTVKRGDAAGNMGIFRVSSGGTVTISGLTMANASQFYGIYNAGNGTLNITDCVVSGNASGPLGGAGLYTFTTGTINLTNTTFSGNAANGGEGGAIRHDGTGTININGCTFSGNFATNIACLENNNTGAINLTNTLINGNTATFDAGAIVNARTGTVTVTGCTITDNHVGNTAGAIANDTTGTVTVTDSTISGNSSGSVGGGIYNHTGIINVIRSTLTNNSTSNQGSSGGGIYNNTTGTINLTSSTISGNHANSSGGGLYFSTLGAGQATIISCTITGNTAVTGGGIAVSNAGSSITLKNTIVALNTATNVSKDIFGPLVSGGYNLIGNNSGGSIAATTGDQIGTSGSPINPLLGPLQNNGGPTFTHAPLTGSPAIDAGNAFGQSADQRGYQRTFDVAGVANVSDGTDIGAQESQSAPTLVRMQAMKASRYDHGALIEWQTGYEADNLGFNLYRQTAGQRHLVNQTIIAGSALTTGGAALLAGRRYACWDDFSPASSAGLAGQDVAYFIEDIDLSGKTSLHGPLTPQAVGGKPPIRLPAEGLSQLGQSPPRFNQVMPELSPGKALLIGSAAAPWDLAGKPAVKLSIRQTGWYRVSQAELIAAGLDQRVDPRRLQLFADGIEQPMLVIGESDGRFDISDAIEFYGTALDTPQTDTRVYWLAALDQAGKRINVIPSQAKDGGASSFAYTVERRDRSVYFSSLRNGEAENFFGAVVTTSGVEQTLRIEHLDGQAMAAASLEVGLQGVTDLPVNPDHLVSVVLNGVVVGSLSFEGQEHKSETLTIGAALLKEGVNTVRLTAAGGSADVSLVDYLRLTYAHTYTADDDALACTTAVGATVLKGMTATPAQTISGFTTPLIRVIDITDPQMPVELAGQIEEAGDGYRVTVGLSSGGRTLMVFTEAGIKQAAAISLNQSSRLRQPLNGADLLVVTRREYFGQLAALAALRQSQKLSVALIDVEDIYDEFSYGNKSVPALKAFITYAATSWKKPPRYLLLGGDASYDGRNYLGYGDTDVVPTKLIDTALMEAASDDWLADIDGDGLADLAVGRLPFRTAGEAALIVAKITNYEQGSASEEMLLVSDANEGYDFEKASFQLQSLIPVGLRISQVNRGRLEAAEARRLLLDGIHRKQLIVNYAGHGSVDLWRGNLLTGADAATLGNNDHLPVFVMMTCLNGYFDDPGLDSLGESLLKAERGGAVAVWASSGMTLPFEQAAMNQQLYRLLFQGGDSPLFGDVTRKAKLAIRDSDVRRTWILLGDPTMRPR